MASSGGTSAIDGDVQIFEPFEFLSEEPALSSIIVIVILLASVIGCAGNILILVSVATQRDLQNVDSVFVVNLACSDLYVTLIADPFSIVGKIVGYRFFQDHPKLCQAVGSLCTVSCVASLMTLSTMSLNRYILICHQSLYRRLFTLTSTILLCLSFYAVGLLFVLLNLAGVGDHDFDHKSLECIWDQMANHNYTRFFGIVMVMLPIAVTGLCYFRLYLHVRKSRMKIHHHSANTVQSGVEASTTNAQSIRRKQMKQSRVEMKDSGDGLKLGRLQNNNDDKRQDSQREPSPADVHKKEEGIFNTSISLGAPGISNVADTKTAEPETKLTVSFREVNASPGDVTKEPVDGVVKLAPRQVAPDPISTNGTNRLQAGDPKGPKPVQGTRASTVRLARTLFIIYLVFSACWFPYAVQLVLEPNDEAPHMVHLVIVAWAHLHPSLNWLVYYHTHSKFRAAFRKLLRIDQCCSR